MIYDGTLTEIKEQFGDRREIHFEIEGELTGLPEELAELAEWQPNPEEAGRVTVAFSHKSISASKVIATIMNRYNVRDLTISDAKIETIVQEIYRREGERHAQIL
jgi:ABC-2 type transport system ATP-binding protein